MANDSSTASGYVENGCKGNTNIPNKKASTHIFFVFNI